MRRRGNLKKRPEYQRTLLAVYMTADVSGLRSIADDAQVGRAAGLPPTTVAKYLRALQKDGVVAIYDRRVFNMVYRVIVLEDHPDAPAFRRHLDLAIMPTRHEAFSPWWSHAPKGP